MFGFKHACCKKKCMLTYVTNSDLKTDCVNMLVNMC